MPQPESDRKYPPATPARCGTCQAITPDECLACSRSASLVAVRTCFECKHHGPISHADSPAAANHYAQTRYVICARSSPGVRLIMHRTEARHCLQYSQPDPILLPLDLASLDGIAASPAALNALNRELVRRGSRRPADLE